MGEIRIPINGRETSYWSDYMAQKLETVVRDWVSRAEEEEIVCWHGSQFPISKEHLRIAKAFFRGDVATQE